MIEVCAVGMLAWKKFSLNINELTGELGDVKVVGGVIGVWICAVGMLA